VKCDPLGHTRIGNRRTMNWSIVNMLAGQGTAKFAKVDTDLMGPARLQSALNQAQGPMRTYDLHMRDRPLAITGA
jgi:hypothetical protein